MRCGWVFVGETDIFGVTDICSESRNGLFVVVVVAVAAVPLKLRGSNGDKPKAAAFIAAAVAILTSGIWEENNAGFESNPFSNGILAPSNDAGNVAAIGLTRLATSANCCNDVSRP